MGYREDMKAIRWTFWRILMLSVIGVILAAGVGFVLRSAGVIGGTVIQRVAFENSYQRTAGLKAQIAQDEATLEEIKVQLQNTELDKSTRSNFEAQARAARIRIRTAREQMR